ncbi:MAG TPA: hypothetical protein VGI84_03985 [Pseudonocardiaceae bacterium]
MKAETAPDGVPGTASAQPGTGRDRLVWVAPPAPQRRRVPPARTMLGGLDLDAAPASVTPPRTWRRAAAFTMAASGGVLLGLLLVALLVVCPHRLTSRLPGARGDTMVVVASPPGRAGDPAGSGSRAAHQARRAASAGRAGAHEPVEAWARSRDTTGAWTVRTARRLDGGAGAVWAAAPSAETSTAPAAAGDGGMAVVRETGFVAGGPHGAAGAAGAAAPPAGEADPGQPGTNGSGIVPGGSELVVGLAGTAERAVPLSTGVFTEASESTVADLPSTSHEAPPVPADVPDTATSAARGVSHWIPDNGLGNAGGRR